MASLNQIAAAYCDSVGKPFDFAFIERIKFSIKYYRAKFARQDVERNPLERGMVQSIVMPMAPVNEADSCIVVAGCKLLRTDNKVPQPVSLKSSASFLYVGPVVLDCADDMPFTETTRQGLMLQQYKQFNDHIIPYIYENSYVYVKDCLRRYVRIDHIFADPNEAFSACENGMNCIDDDSEWPISPHMLDMILKGLQQSELRLIPKEEQVKAEQEMQYRQN